MNIEVRVGVRERAWRLLRSEEYLRWLADRPWATGGGVLGLRLPACRRASVEAALSAALPPEDREGPAWEQLDGNAADLTTALRSWLVSPCESIRELVTELSSSCNARPRLFVVSLTGRPPLPWLQNARELVDVARKIPDPCALTFLITSDAPSELQSLSAAWPEVSMGSPTNELRWCAYLHERVAWHAGGDLEIAAAVADALGEPDPGDERHLEATLRADARRRADALDREVRAALSSSLSALEPEPELRLSEFLPGGSRSCRPVPWLAHALLLETDQHPEWLRLRAAYCCRPLAMRILGRCIDLEARVVDRLRPALEALTPPDEARKQLEGYDPANPRNILGLMPPEAPRPRDAWDVAGLGAVTVNAPERNRRHLHRLRILRNHLAHGGPVGWKALEEIESLEQDLC